MPPVRLVVLKRGVFDALREADPLFLDDAARTYLELAVDRRELRYYAPLVCGEQVSFGETNWVFKVSDGLAIDLRLGFLATGRLVVGGVAPRLALADFQKIAQGMAEIERMARERLEKRRFAAKEKCLNLKDCRTALLAFARARRMGENAAG